MRKYTKILVFSLIFTGFFVLVGAHSVFAESVTISPPYSICDPDSSDRCFMDIIDTILDWLMRIAIPIGIIMLVVSGIFMISAQGNPEMVNKAKKIFKYAIIGIAIIFIGRGFITLLESILDLAG